MATSLRQIAIAVVTTVIVAWSGSVVGAQKTPETFVATASLRSATATRTAPVTIVVTRQTTEQERGKVVEALRTGGTAGVAALLKAMADVGYIEIGGRRSVLKYAYARPTDTGRLITVITASPIVYLGADIPGAKPKTGFDLALALLDLPGSGSGTGELAPAAKVKVTEAGAIQTEDYGADVVRLTDVQVKK